MKNTVLTKAANALYKIEGKGKKDDDDDNNVSKKKNDKYVDAASQDLIPVVDIIGDIVVTTRGHYECVMQTIPINFEVLSDVEKARICNSFKTLFEHNINKIRIKVVSDQYSPLTYFQTISDNNKGSMSPEYEISLMNYVQLIKDISTSSITTKSFYMFVEYEGKSTDKEEIFTSLYETKSFIASVLENCSCKLITYKTEAEATKATAEILYKFFNRRTHEISTLAERETRFREDYAKYIHETGLTKTYDWKDLLAPKGAYFDRRECVFVDGTFYTFLGIKREGWYKFVGDGWASILSRDANCIDVDFIFERRDGEFIANTLRTQNRTYKAHAARQAFIKMQKDDDVEKHSKVINSYKNNQMVIDAVTGNQAFYDCSIIITIRGDSERSVLRIKRDLVEGMKKYFKYDDSFLCAEDYYKATMPFFDTLPTMLLTRLRKNILSSQIGTMFPFISYELVNNSGFLLGTATETNSLVILNNFDTNIFSNGHTFIVGTSGMGKTFTELTLCGRMALNGARVTCICPTKGFEYKGLCKIHDGLFVDLTPESKDVFNPLDILRRDKIDESLLDEQSLTTSSLKYGILAEKERTLITWFNLILMGATSNQSLTLTPDEEGAMSLLLERLYYKHGITNDESSLIGKKATDMPILAEWADAIKHNDALKDKYSNVLNPFVSENASCGNLNGYTTVDFTNKKLIAFDCSEEKIPASLVPSFIYLAFSNAYSRIKESLKTKDFLVLDEVWKMLKLPTCADQVKDAIKVMRGYNGSCVLATQDIKDFFGSAEEYGSAIVSNCQINILLGLKPIEIPLVREKIKITDVEANLLTTFKRGQALILAGGNRINIKIPTTYRELDAYNTDPNRVIKKPPKGKELGLYTES